MTLHVLDQLPLWVEGDLSAADLALVEGHLAECPTCQEAAARLQASQAWLREAMTPPFIPIDHENLCHAVMAQVRVEAAAKPIRRLTVRHGLLAACAASLLVAALVWRQEHAAVTLRPLGAPSALPAGATQTVPVIPPPMARQGPVRVGPLQEPLLRPEEPVSSPIEGPARIEFQTADPNIRIIWLAQAKPLPETNPLIQEEP